MLPRKILNFRTPEYGHLAESNIFFSDFKMSTFTDYNCVSNDYDARRSPIGIDLYVGQILASTGKRLPEVSLHFKVVL